MNFVPCLTWIKRGIAKETPDKVQLSKGDLKRLIDESITDLKDLKVEDNNEESSNEHDKDETMDNELDEDLKKYNLDSYDDDNDSVNHVSLRHLVELPDDQDEESKEDDQYIDSEDEDNFKIRPEDNLIVVGHVNDDCSTLEVYVYNEEDNDLYVHHDIILPAFPVCLEWFNFGSNENTINNYLAVGDMTPVIKIWDLNMVDVLEPVGKLGRKLKKKERAKKGTSGDHGHVDAVLNMSWNKNLSHALASGSADHSVIMWDLSNATPVVILRHHTDKVQSVEWHPFEAQILLTGSSDGNVTLYDARALEEKKTWAVKEEIEKIVWNHFEPFTFFAGTDKGNIFCFDVRQSEPLYTFDAHNKGISDMTLSESCPGLLATTGSYTSVRIWDIRNNPPRLVENRKLKEGNLLACGFSPDSPFVLAVGGDKPSANFKVMNLLDSQLVTEHFAPSGETEEQPGASQDIDSQLGACAFTKSSPASNTVTKGKKILKKKAISKNKRT